MDGEEFTLDPDLVEIVLAEAQENLEEAIVMLNASERTMDQVDALFRCFHSIKGNCAMAQRTDLSETAHRMETELDKIRTQGRALNTNESGLFLELSDLLVLLLLDGDATVMEPVNRCLLRLEATTPGGMNHEEVPENVDAAAMGSLPIAEAPASLSAPLSSQQPLSSDFAVPSSSGVQEGRGRLKVDVSMLIETMQVAGELFQIDERLKHIANQWSTKTTNGETEAEAHDGLNQVSREFDGAIEKLYELLLDIQRLPVSQIASPLERAVRDIRRKTGKEIELHVQGKDLRVDKQVLQVLRDPIMHMVRNSADHGVEMPELRESLGKPRTGRITLRVEDRDDIVAVTIEDDGAGINLERVKEKAVEKGIVEASALNQLSTSEICEFIFHPGFSTASEVSDLSGRGVGMDVVLQQIRGAGGLVTTHTTPGQGTVFRMEIPKAGSPVTDGLAVRTRETVHLIPLKNVVTFVGRREMRVWRQPDHQVLARVGGGVYPLLRVPGEPDAACLESPRTIGVILRDRQGVEYLIPVDDVLGRRKALVQKVDKMAGEEFERSEVCILGDGTMAFSLQVDEIATDPRLVWRSRNDHELGHELEHEFVAQAG